MNALLGQLPPGFFPDLLAGMAVNLRIAGIALMVGLAIGIPLALARTAGGIAGAASTGIVALMRASPTFVVMFFLLNVIPTHLHLFGAVFTLPATTIVALSLLPYSAYYIADNATEAIRQLRLGAPHAALLFLPNLARAFFVLVMSSGAGAAIGVTEGISVILRESAQLESLHDRLELFAIGVLCFGIVLQSGFAALNLVRRQLGGIATRRLGIVP